MGLERTSPYLPREGDGPGAAKRDWRSPGPCTVRRAPSCSPPAPHPSIFSLLVFGNFKVRCRRSAGGGGVCVTMNNYRLSGTDGATLLFYRKWVAVCGFP